MHSLKYFMVVATLTAANAGCLSPEQEQEEESTAGSDAALTQSQAFEELVGHGPDGKTFKSGGASDCGHTITLERSNGPANTGKYTYAFHDCERDPMGASPSSSDRMRSSGTFKLVGGWLGGLVTDPTLEITPRPSPDRPGDDATPWSYKVRTFMAEDPNVPRGTVYLESTSPEHAKLVPEGFSS